MAAEDVLWGNGEIEPIVLPEYTISAARSSHDLHSFPLPARIIPGSRLAAAPSIDAALREDPAFSLFRRQGSTSAHPTAQGVSLRNIGPSGASRTLVVLDEVPLNDPFGGWINWSQLPALSLAGAEILHGGAGGLWGNAALGGVLALTSLPPEESSNSIRLQVDTANLRRLDGQQFLHHDTHHLRLNIQTETTDGFHPLAAENRGAVDTTLSRSHRLGQVAWRHPISVDTEATATLRFFDEKRTNGTPLQDNTTRLAHASLTIASRAESANRWKAGLWSQDQEFSSYFSAVAPDRSTEIPSNDQFAVPAQAAGFFAHREFGATGHSATLMGCEGRWVRGETREHFLFREGRFTRLRKAGGAQASLGIFLHHNHMLDTGAVLWAGLRADQWADFDGHLSESERTSGEVLRDDQHPHRTGTALSPTLGVSLPLSGVLRLRAAGYRAFRQPTLNELYRPFRVGTTTTLANPQLRTETLQGIDLGLEFHRPYLQLSAGWFHNRLEDAVGNLTLSREPSSTLRQRQNIPSIHITGGEVAAAWLPLPSLELRAALVLAHARIRSAPADPTLAGRRLAQAPNYSLSLSATWRASAATALSAQLRALGRQFEDEENRLVLDAARTLDMRLDQRLSEPASLFLELQNALDARVPTRRPTSELTSYDQPRTLRGGLSVDW